MRKLKIILLSSLLLIIFSPAIANAGCVWREEMTTINDNGTSNQPSGGCITDEIRPEYGSATKCAGDKPADKNSFNVNIRSICCCSANTENTTATPKKPLFVMPIPEVKIPTVNLTEATCELDPKTNAYVCAIPWIGEYINGIYKYGINIAGILAALVLMGGGLLWLISGGDASKITKAKEMIIGSVTGLIILMSSYIILTQVNPDLVKMKSISLGYIEKQDAELGKAKLSSDAENYRKAGCPSDADLGSRNGVEFYATGYFKMPWRTTQDKRYLCMVHMQGTCPAGVDTVSNCVENGNPIFPGYPNYQPCRQFTQEQYANYFNRPDLIVGQTIAGPSNCGGALARNNQVCFNGHTYKITDTGGGIQGKRIDILSGSEAEAISNTGKGILKSGPCKQ